MTFGTLGELYYSVDVKGLACFRAPVLGLQRGSLGGAEFCLLPLSSFMITLFLFLSVPAHLRKIVGDVESHSSIHPSIYPSIQGAQYVPGSRNIKVIRHSS